MIDNSIISRVNRVGSFIIAILLIMSSITGFFHLPQWVYYGTMGVILLVVVASHGIRLKQPSIVLFIFICALSLLINQPPAYFNAWTRLLGFIMLLCAVSPLFNNHKISLFRYSIFDSIMTLLVYLSIGSLICYFLGINFFVRNGELLEIEVGHFSGLFNHSMVMGPASALASIYLLVKFLGRKKKKTLYLVSILACLACTLLSASRVAVGGCILGMIVAYMRFYSGHLSKGLLVLLVLVALLAVTFPVWGGLTDFVIGKQEANMSMGGTFASRESLFAARIQEIIEHPLIGVGFCCVDPRFGGVDMSRGGVEPGSSWLAIFSMTGIFGLLTFMSLYYKKIREAFRISATDSSSLFVGCMAFFLFHLLFEGYILAVGNFMGLFFWLLLGSLSTYTKN